MATYNQNFLTMMNGHTNLYDEEGKPNIKETASDPKNTADIRQIMTNIVGRGYKSLSDESIRNDFARLTNLVGLTQARKLVDTAVIFNQNPIYKNTPVDAKLQSFFTTNHGDPQVNTLIKEAGNLGDGVVAGYNRSPDVGNQKLAGTYSKIDSINQDTESIQNMVTQKLPK